MAAFVVSVIGALVAFVGLTGLLQPATLLRFLERAWATPRGLWLAVGFRLVFGIALLLAAAGSRAPLLLTIVGAISLVSAAVVPILGYARARSFVAWWSQRPAAFVRGWSLVACAFGGFLVYAVA